MFTLQGAINTVLWGVGGLACTCLVLLVALQERLIYVPVIPGLPKEYPFTPARLRLRYEDVWLRAADGTRLHSWLIKFEPEIRGPTILFFQENAGNIAHRLESIDIMMRRLECNVFMLSYRGYGASEGQPSQRGISLDAQAALDHLLGRPDIDRSRIVVFGRSLGGAVAADLVYRNPGKVAALVLENTFTSILDMAPVMLPPMRYLVGTRGVKPLNALVRSQWRTIDIIGKIEEPVLFLSGALDEMVPPAHMAALYAAARNNPKCLFTDFETGMHMDTWMRGGDRYWRVLRLFLHHHAGGPPALGGGGAAAGGVAEAVEAGGVARI